MKKSSPKRTYIDYLLDIADAMEKIEKFTEGFTLESFREDEKTVFAVVRALEIIGEATTKIPATVKNHHKEIPWKNMAGIRNKLIHEYFGVNMVVVWKTIKEDLPELKIKVAKMLEDLKITKLF
ncbi:MAG TPA: DUF86 domain-containing protein [Negativicutes bacterium]|nr:DUF86 domain-containing protein [Negativicutes bacterium]